MNVTVYKIRKIYPTTQKIEQLQYIAQVRIKSVLGASHFMPLLRGIKD